MNVFEQQLRSRIRQGSRAAAENVREMIDAVMGKERIPQTDIPFSAEIISQTVRICEKLRVAVPDRIPECENISEQIDAVLQPSGAMKRKVRLDKSWWKTMDGPLLAWMKADGMPVALIPEQFGGYSYTDRKSGIKVRISCHNQDLFEEEAYCFYRPLPNTPLSGRDFIRFLLSGLQAADILIALLAALFSSLIGMTVPFATGYAFSSVIPLGDHTLLVSLGTLLFSSAISTWLINAARVSISSRISNRLDVLCENAVFARVLRFPVSFFGDKSTGGLARKVMTLNAVPAILTELLFGTVLTLIVSAVYIVQILTVAKPLAGPVFVIYFTEILLFMITVLQEGKVVQEQFGAEEENSGLVYALLSGIQKIRISGSEQRAFSKWIRTYSQRTRLMNRILFPATFRIPLMTAVHMFGALWIYAVAFRNNLSISQFAAFSGAFGLTMGGVAALAAAGTSFSAITPILKNGEAILRTVPETTEGKRGIKRLTGSIRLQNVSFRYSEDGPMILDHISLQITPEEYIAVVGKSGCGKSTLLKLLLGFEKPQEGSICYDDRNLDTLDMHSLRRNIGTVLQDGKLFAGDIFSNITITAPWMSMDDAWNAAEKAGIADDIRAMPMGMHTLITEGSGGISGGQKQRLLIARAICPRPGILMLDEATSALDNITQKTVTDSMDEMKCTRIVIAHRLSTIRHCDRILVLDHGKIAEDGTYEELLARNGLFSELVSRQMTESER